MASSDLAYWVLVRLHYVRAALTEHQASAAAITSWLEAHKKDAVGGVSEDEVYRLLRKLEQIGLVLALHDEGEVKPMSVAWEARGGLPPHWEVVWRDGGVKGDGRDGGDGGMPPTSPEGDDPGGEGLQEVLAHPVLFSLPQQHLSSRIGEAFDLGPDWESSSEVGR